MSEAIRRDRRGRRRAPGQERGLRPRFPALPAGWITRALRVSLPTSRWHEFEALVASFRREQPTEARAAGAALSHLLDAAHGRGSDRHWLDWEREKTYRILRETHRAA